MRAPLSIACVVLTLLLPLGTAIGSESFNADRSEADQYLIADLLKLAGWCKSPKLFGKRDETHELILELDPDAKQSRKTLKFKRDKDGTWVQNPKYKRPRNWNPKAIPGYEKRLQAALHAYRDSMLDACIREVAKDGHTTAADAQVALLDRLPNDPVVLAALKKTLLAHHAKLQGVEVPIALERVAYRLNHHFPKDPDVRRALGEVQVDGRWILPATVAARKSGTKISAQAATALGAVPPIESSTPTEAEKAADGATNGVYATAHMRVLGTTGAASLQSIAKHAEAAGPFLEAVLGREVGRAPSRTFFVFTDEEHWIAFLDRYPGLTPEVRAHARASSKGSGYPLTGTAYACLPVGRPEVELDICIDVTFQTLLNEAFSTWHEAKAQWQELPGWVRIGVSDYLTYRLTGKRILTTVGGEVGYGEKKPDVKDRSPKAGTDILPLALETFKRNQAPGTHLMLGKGLVAFTRDDAVTSFALASYLLEGRRDQAVKILTEVGKGRDTKRVVKEVLGMSIEALHVELVRWIEEMIATAK